MSLKGLVLILWLLLCNVVACADAPAASDAALERYVSIEIRGVPSELAVGEARRIFVDAVTDRGERTELGWGSPLSWDVSNWDVVDIDDGADFDKYVIALAPGSAILTTSYQDPSTASQLEDVVTLTVIPAE